LKILSLTLAACLLASAAHAEAPSVAKVGDLPAVFDDLGVAVQTLKSADGRTVHFTDTGEPGFRPVLFMGGTGTSARAFEMTEFLKSMRKQLKLRFITVERNGFGDSPITAGWGYADYVAEVRAVLDHLQVQRAAGVAISGGGPYMAQVAAAMPERLISLHLLAAATQRPPEDAVCKLSADQLTAFMKSQVQNPKTWWGFPKDSPTHKIPGFADRAYDEGARAFYIRGQMGDPAPEVAEVMRYCGPSPDLSAVKAPAFIYQGTADALVTVETAERWKAQLPNVVEMRLYPGEGHDVQYRHWDQLLLDVAGHAELTVLCASGRSLAVPKAQAERKLKAGATLGVCAWAKPAAG
jgi:pimeloyl-ACP methyl ester carboxylesterase